MVWFTIWFLVILKIPALYIAWLVWWSVKDPPQPGVAGAGEGLGGGGVDLRPQHGPRVPVPGRRPGPHGTPDRGRRGEPARATRARRAR
ncbi:MAG TPA: hypothetical protein VG479_04460 [Gaiellaceae bacterium]|jgi:hypothetical protein|nr:hypothetical protein [Gaiellaceae bacterium]